MEAKDNSHAVLDKNVSWLAALAATSYLFIHIYDTKWSLPILVWSLISVIVEKGISNITNFLTLASWIFLWISTKRPSAQRLIHFVICILILWFPFFSFPTSMLKVQTIWFWVPMTIFATSTIFLLLYMIRRAAPSRIF